MQYMDTTIRTLASPENYINAVRNATVLKGVADSNGQGGD
jgi:multicomponent K+:H+ antiporter subunit D